MRERRTEKISTVLTPALRARLDAYADRHRWSMSTAIAELIEQGIISDESASWTAAEDHAISARYHQHALYALRAREQMKADDPADTPAGTPRQPR